MQSDSALTVRLEGVDELRKALADASASIRKKAVRSALRKAAAVIQREARANAPVLMVPTPRRNTGTVKRRISVRASKFARAGGNEGVYVSVKPLSGKSDTSRFGKRGAKNPNDPYYWWFLEFGTKKMAKRPFLGPAAESKGNEAIATFMKMVVPQIERLNNRVGRM